MPTSRSYYVSWFDSVRFVNWLTSGQTESGTYTITDGGRDWGTVAIPDHTSLTNGWFLPTENEWYKAAYFDANKPGGGGYWDYATGTDAMPDNTLPSADSGNSANYNVAVGNWGYPLTDVGAYTQSDSPLGTFDQGGNVFEWNEAVAVRGGACWLGRVLSACCSRPAFGLWPGTQDFWFGFRIAARRAAASRSSRKRSVPRDFGLE